MDIAGPSRGWAVSRILAESGAACCGRAAGGSGRPLLREQLGLVDDGLDGPILLVGWVAVAAQDALDGQAALCAAAPPHGPARAPLRLPISRRSRAVSSVAPV